MFEDRTRYDFNKLDQNARTQVLLEEKKQEKPQSDAHQKLFAPKEEKPKEKPTLFPKEQEKQAEPILNKKHDLDVSNMPSSKYLQSFANQTIDDEPKTEPLQQQSQKVTQGPNLPVDQSHVDYAKLIDEAQETKVDTKSIANELKSAKPEHKKSFSFRIKLVTGVYCILVALFGGWVIGNAVKISQINSNIHQTIEATEQVNTNIADIVLKIKSYDNATQDPNQQSGITEIVTEVIEVTPEPIQEPNKYEKKSNWFDAFCNWIYRLFGGK
ncbi:MAG: hypothetical protein E7378_03910 [Clostridiales bacterium]|nr:hypothetical protein [Clostridiales bacterium]